MKNATKDAHFDFSHSPTTFDKKNEQNQAVISCIYLLAPAGLQVKHDNIKNVKQKV